MNERELLQAGYRYALSLRPAGEDAEDLVQEAWLRLHRRSGQVTDKPLLFTTIRNIYIDHYRRRQLVVFEPLDDAPEAADPSAAIDEALGPEALAGPLAALRDAEREALFLQVVEGYTAQEIAALTDRSRNTVLSLIHRAKRKLARALGAEDAKGAAPVSKLGNGKP